MSHPSPSEMTSWSNSLPVLRDDLLSADLGDSGIILEASLPMSSQRLDAIVLGRKGSGRIGAAVVELKQWNHAEVESVDDRLIQLGNRLILHPQQQVAQYVWYLRDFHSLVETHRLSIDGSAYLHNAASQDTDSIHLGPLEDLQEFPMFTADDRRDFQTFLSEKASGGQGEDVLVEYLEAPFKPSKKLLDHVAQELAGHQMFTLIGDQFVAYQLVRRAMDRSMERQEKEAIIVTGGPGTGKSVIAVRIVGEAARRGLNVRHATGSKSFTETLRKVVGKRAANLFRYFNQFGDIEADELDVLVCDEAHRIRATSAAWYTPKAKRTGLPQVDELIQVAKVPVFLLDQNQVVKPGEIGTVASIEEAARRNGATLARVDLNEQFRSQGSATYIAWVEQLLGIAPGGPVPWSPSGDERFELMVVDSPREMEVSLEAKLARGFNARMSAGYCWPWSDPSPDGRLVDDVVIDDWARPWNARPGKKVIDAPSASYWATDPRGFGQVGCIYTAQGFEYDYAGVIIGPDFVWRGGAWETIASKRSDPGTRSADNLPELVRNVYKVLLTRGLKGCMIYSVDETTSEMLRSLF